LQELSSSLASASSDSAVLLSLQRDLESLNAQYVLSKSKEAALEQQLLELHDNHEAVCRSLQQDLDQLRTELVERTDQESKSALQIVSLRKEIEEQRVQIADLQLTSVSSQNEVDRTKNDSNNRISQLQAQITDLNRAHSDFESQVASLTNQIVQRDEALSSLNLENDVLKSKISSAELEITSLIEKNNSLDRQLLMFQSQSSSTLDDLKIELLRAKENLETSQSEAMSFMEETNKAQALLNEEKQRFNDLNIKFMNLEAQFRNLETQKIRMFELESSLKEVTSDRENASKKCESLFADLRAEQMKVSELSNLVTQNEDIISTAKATQSELELKIQSLEAALVNKNAKDSASDEVIVLKQKLGVVVKEIKAMRSSKMLEEKKRQDAVAESVALKALSNELNQKNTDVELKLKDALRVKDEIASQLNKLGDELRSVRMNLQESVNEKKVLEGKLQEVESRMSKDTSVNPVNKLKITGDWFELNELDQAPPIQLSDVVVDAIIQEYSEDPKKQSDISSWLRKANKALSKNSADLIKLKPASLVFERAAPEVREGVITMIAPLLASAAEDGNARKKLHIFLREHHEIRTDVKIAFTM
jgi:chromosome segregation ATPase